MFGTWFHQPLWGRYVEIIARHALLRKRRYECGPQVISYKNKSKIESKEIPSRLIPHLLVAFTRQLKILATTLELLGNLKPSYLFYLGLGNFPTEWNTGKNLKTHLGHLGHSEVSQARSLHACWTRMLYNDRLETIDNSQSTNSAKN